MLKAEDIKRVGVRLFVRGQQLTRINEEDPKRPLPAHDSVITDIALSPNGQFLASRPGDGEIRLWHLARKPVASHFVTCLADSLVHMSINNRGDLLIVTPDHFRIHSPPKWVCKVSRSTVLRFVDPKVTWHTESHCEVVVPEGTFLCRSSLAGCVWEISDLLVYAGDE